MGRARQSRTPMNTRSWPSPHMISSSGRSRHKNIYIGISQHSKLLSSLADVMALLACLHSFLQLALKYVTELLSSFQCYLWPTHPTRPTANFFCSYSSILYFLCVFSSGCFACGSGRFSRSCVLGF